MKYILILLFVSSNVMAQKDTVITLPMQDGKVFYQKVFEDSGQTKNDLFIKAQDVFLRLFPATKNVIQEQDKGNGIIAGKGNFPVTFGTVKFTLRILTKDNKYKVEIFDFYLFSTLFKNDTETPIEKNYAIAIEKRRSKNICNSWITFNNNVLYIFNQVEREMSKKNDF